MGSGVDFERKKRTVFGFLFFLGVVMMPSASIVKSIKVLVGVSFEIDVWLCDIVVRDGIDSGGREKTCDAREDHTGS